MPLSKPLDPYICIRCWRNILKANKPSRRLQSSIAPVFLSQESSQAQNDQQASSPALPPYKRFQFGRSSERRQEDSTPKAQGWSTLLQNKALGQAASVLVLRDTEQSRRGRKDQQNPTQKQVSLGDADLEKFLNSLKKQGNDPAQSEVNASIDSLKPDIESEDPSRPAVIVREQYEEVLKQLNDGFNQTQLARYITQSLTEAHLAPRPRSTIHPLAAAWLPVDKSTSGQNKKRKPSPKGKRGLANSIVRSVWNLEIREEIEADGSLDMTMPPERISYALLEDQKTAFEQLEKTKNVRIEVIETKNVVRISAPRYTAIDAAEEVEMLLRGPYETELDIGPLKLQSTKKKTDATTTSAILDIVAAACQCTCTWVKGQNTIVLRGRDQQATDRFTRLLMSQVHVDQQGYHYLLSVRSLTDDSGMITIAPSENNVSDGAVDKKSYGRYTLPLKLAPGETGAPRSLPAPDEYLSPDLINTLVDAQGTSRIRLSNASGADSSVVDAVNRRELTKAGTPGWQDIQRTRFVARFGHILHPLEKGSVFQSIATRKLLGLPQDFDPEKTDESYPRQELSKSPKFLPTMGGLPRALQRTYSDAAPDESRSRVMVSFDPSPWSYSPKRVRGIPPLKMELSIRHRDRQVEISDLSATISTRTSSIMVPYTGLDIQASRRDFVRLQNPGNSSSIQQYLYDMIVSYGVTGQIVAPPTLQLSIPTYFLSKDASKTLLKPSKDTTAEGEEVLADYIVSSYHHNTDFSLPFGDRGHNLVYTRSRDLDTGHTTEGVSLQCDAEPQPNDQQKRVDVRPRLTEFLEVSQGVLRMLNHGLSKTKEMERRIGRDRRYQRRKQVEVVEMERVEGLEGPDDGAAEGDGDDEPTIQILEQ